MNLEKANNVDFSKYELHNKFPEITVSLLPDDVVNLVMNIASGTKGEFTSLGQYMYQHFILFKNDSFTNIYTAMERIAIREMIHLEVLSKKLHLCGSDPQYCRYIDNNKDICNYWSAGYVNYIQDIKGFIIDNINLEKIAIEDYNRLLKISNDENLNEIVNLILKDEHSHLNYFEDVLTNLND